MFLWARFHGAKRIFLKDMGGIFGKAVDFTKPVRGLGMKGGEVMGECRDRKAPLKWGMVTLLVLCWLLPLAVIAYVMLYVAAIKTIGPLPDCFCTTGPGAMPGAVGFS